MAVCCTPDVSKVASSSSLVAVLLGGGYNFTASASGVTVAGGPELTLGLMVAVGSTTACVKGCWAGGRRLLNDCLLTSSILAMFGKDLALATAAVMAGVGECGGLLGSATALSDLSLISSLSSVQLRGSRSTWS